jgi:rod shape-determining protein MreB and related proteins
LLIGLLTTMLDRFFSLFSHDIGIDLGTANTLIYVKGKGIVIREPSVVAMHKKTKQVIAIGSDAKKMLGKTPPSIITVRPLKGGVIADFDATEAMISHYIKQVHERQKFLPAAFARPKVVIGIPSAITEVERRAVWEAALTSGAREAYLIEEPMAAAIGEGVEVFQSNGVMVVDIGGGTTEIAVISLGGIVVGKSLRVAGTDMDQAILHYVRLKHGLLLGEKTAEDVKIGIGSVYKSAKSKIKSQKAKEEAQESTIEEGEDIAVKTERGERMAIVRGRDIETGLPKSLRLTEAEVREALAPAITEIIQGISDVIEDAPPELISDILEHGIVLTGGGANLAGLDQIIVEQARMPVIVSEDPLTSVARGCGKVLEDAALLAKIKVYGGIK